MARLLFFLVLCFVGAFAGSECPLRRNIYPCTCVNVYLSKGKMHTTVTCHGLSDSSNLESILPTLSSVDIDKFHMYDLFWKADKLEAEGESQNVLPSNFLSVMNAKEIEIADSSLTSCFACQMSSVCRNSVTTKFKIMNSTSSKNICTLCTMGAGMRLPWIGCLTKLQHFQLSHGNLESLSLDFLPLSLPELKILDLSHNKIVKIDPNVFKNTPNLQTLDLSHNNIEHIHHVFKQEIALEYLDLSFNSIAFIGKDFIRFMPKLKSVNLAYNNIIEFKKSEWETAPASLRNIDFTENPIRCDCNIKWLNSTLPVHVAISGSCSSPDEYANSRLRAASRYLNERCDETGNIGARNRTAYLARRG